MKITDVRTVLLTGPCSNDPFISCIRSRRSAAFIEIHTDTEFMGVGETYGGYFCPEMIPEIVNFFKPILIGQDVSNISELWKRMYHCGNFWCRVGLGLIALTGIEAALYDLKGKIMGLPVYELLGGRKHNKLLCYATGGPSNYPESELKRKLDFYQSLGFKGVKLGAGSCEGDKWYTPTGAAEAADFEGDKIAFVRSYVGKNFHIMMDGHMGNNPVSTWQLPVAQAVMKALEPYNLFFFEEPLHYTDPWGYSELCKSTSIPIAGGECLTGTYEWRVFAEHDSFDIGQPDASFSGGLGEFMKIAAMLESRGRRIATHSWGAGGSFMQNIHCGFAAANTAILEVAPAYGPMHSDIIGDSFVMKDGYVLPPEKPGLGITWNDEIKNRYSFVRDRGEFNDVPGKILAEYDKRN